MRLLLAFMLLISFSAYGQRVRENIKQQGTVKAPVAKPAQPVKPIRR